MSKKQKENLTGFSWHIGYLKMDDFDERRDKRRCVYYVDESKEKDKDKYCADIKVNYCRIAGVRCKGSSHCGNYKEVGEKPDKSVYKPTRVIASIPCSIPMATEIHTKDKKVGFLVKYKDKTLTLLINGKECGYLYPQAFEQGYLIATPEIEKCIKNDKDKAVWK